MRLHKEFGERRKVESGMKEIFTTLFMMVATGAIIGGVTNYLAIKMIFKPYKAIYIGKWRLPFTPGLIPKRRGEMAEQMGKLVINHLLTPEGIQKKLQNERFQSMLTQFAAVEVEKKLKTEETLEQLLEQLDINEPAKMAEDKIGTFLEIKYENWMRENQDVAIKEIIPQKLVGKVEGELPQLSNWIVQSAKNYFASEEGKESIQRMADDFVQKRSGMIKSMLQMFLGNVKLGEKLQPEIIKFLNHPGTEELLTSLLRKEWRKLLDKRTAEFEEKIGRDSLLQFIKQTVFRFVQVHEIFQMPISQLTATIRPYIISELIPKASVGLSKLLADKISVLMEKMKLNEIVKEQVDSFSVERLEEMVFSIINKELRMITFLGALLGGLVGVFQGISAIWIL